jgi:hypothetical protein
MFGSEVLDVAIGLVFVYLILSMICSAVCEMIESLARKRADFLESGLREMLSDDKGGLVRQIYDHPLVSSLFPGSYEPGHTRNLPSYIPPANFALALMDVVGLLGSIPNATPVSAAGPGGLPTASVSSPERIRATIRAAGASSPLVSRALMVLAESAGYDPAQIRIHIEAWYNSSMDRVSGGFKRRSQAILLTLGFLISLAINADTISITNSLATDKSVRTSLIAAATEASKGPPPLNSSASNDHTAGTGDAFEKDLGQIRNAGLPLGWSASQNDLRHIPVTWRGWLAKLLGITLTAFAVSLGGPFWFDTLNRFMAVRSTVKPDEKTGGDKKN